jgi:hypothetical protein
LPDTLRLNLHQLRNVCEVCKWIVSLGVLLPQQSTFEAQPNGYTLTDLHKVATQSNQPKKQNVMSKELIKLIRKNPELFDEYRMLVFNQVREHQERQARKAAKK